MDNGANAFLPPSPVIPNSLPISNITNAINAIITVTIPNYYIVGQLVHLSVPQSYGMGQANQMTAQILSIDGLNFTTSLNTLLFDPFVIPATYQEQPATLTSQGSRNTYNFTTLPYRALNGNFGN